MRHIQRIWKTFFENYPIGFHIPLFETDGLTVRTHERGSPPKTILTRSGMMEQQMEQTVALIIDAHKDPSTTIDGLIYCMYTLNGDKMIPWYIGKAERVGRDGHLSTNINKIQRKSGPFGRWGYGNAYHIGDLSAAVFGYEDKIKPKYEHWRDVLFKDYEQLLLNEPVYLWVKAWDKTNAGPWTEYGPTSLSFLEYQLIGVASKINPELLNSEGTSFGR